MIGPKRKPGRPTHAIEDFMNKWGLTYRQARWWYRLEPQLDSCKDDASRRILLGIGEQFKEGEKP